MVEVARVEKSKQLQENEVRGLTVEILSGALNGNPEAVRQVQESIHITQLKTILAKNRDSLKEYEAKLEAVMRDLKAVREEAEKNGTSKLREGSEHNIYVYRVKKLREDRKGLIEKVERLRSLVEAGEILLEAKK